MKHVYLLKVLIVGLLASQALSKMWAGNLDEKSVMMAPGVSTQSAFLPDDGISNEMLFKGYVQQMLDDALPVSKRPQAAKRRSAVAQLTGNDLRVYDLLVPELKKIANGTVTKAEFSFLPTDIFGQSSWTASDLGVSSIIVDNAFSPEALASFNSATAINFSKVVSALLVDFPFELYWFDKTRGWSCNYAGYGSDGSSISFVEGSKYTFYFRVAKEYSAMNEEGTTEVKEGITASVTTAISKAKQIVSNNSGRSTYDKLHAYKDAICDMVIYNNEAAGGGIAYGNPWQLVWVFDGDENTNVVCEGYSKAFKYLCDLSDLDPGVECMIVTGNMGGAHMWNVMKMDDGNRYLVDVTNCDDGTVGYPDKLFLANGFIGSYDTYYYCNWTSPNVTYIYSNETRNTFPEADLTISTLEYPNVTIDPAENIITQLEKYAGKDLNVAFARDGLTISKPVTICLPYAFTPNGSEGSFYEFTGVSKEGSEWHAEMTIVHSGALEAQKPYLFVPAVSNIDFGGRYTVPASINASSTKIGDWTFQGTYEKKMWTAVGNDYGFAAEDGTAVGGGTVKAGDFVRAGNGASIEAMRAYLTYNEASVRRRADGQLPDFISVILVNGNNTTNIGTIDMRTGEFINNVWYDLNGRQIESKPFKNGIYINDKGQKVLVK